APSCASRTARSVSGSARSPSARRWASVVGRSAVGARPAGSERNGFCFYILDMRKRRRTVQPSFIRRGLRAGGGGCALGFRRTTIREVLVPFVSSLLAWANVPFTVALGVAIGFALLQMTGLLGLLAGGGDHDGDADGGHEADHEVDGGHEADADA